VRLCGDDRLCHECDVENERRLREIRAKQSADAPTSDNTSNTRGASRVTVENGVKHADVASCESDSNKRSGKNKQKPKISASSSPLLEAEGDSVGASAECKSEIQESMNRPANGIIIDELLAYVRFYRDGCTTGYLYKLLVTFFHPTEIGEAKRKVIQAFSAELHDCSSVVCRRQSTSRLAHEAEAEDILSMFDVLDNKGALDLMQFVAAALDRIPRFCPEQLNDCTVAENQSQLNTRVTNLAGIVTDSVNSRYSWKRE